MFHGVIIEAVQYSSNNQGRVVLFGQQSDEVRLDNQVARVGVGHRFSLWKLASLVVQFNSDR